VKGLSPAWLGAVVIVFVALLLVVPRMLGSAFGGAVKKVSAAGTSALTNAPASLERFFPEHVPLSPDRGTAKVDVPKAHLTGYAAIAPGRMNVYLSDGRVTENFRVIDKRTVEIDGERFTFAPTGVR
jgi:hypothetical protein